MDITNASHVLDTAETLADPHPGITATAATAERSLDTPLAEHGDLQMASTAAACVLDTPELMENILTHLTIGDITKADQVCRFFRAVIRRSKALRRPMFRVLGSTKLLEHILAQDLSVFELVRSRRVCRFLKATTESSKILRQAMFLDPEPIGEKIIFDSSQFSELNDGWGDYGSYPIHLIVTKPHPLLRDLERKGMHWVGNPETSNDMDITLLLDMKPGSWQSMLISQPTAPDTYADTYPGDTQKMKENTLGELVEILRRPHTPQYYWTGPVSRMLAIQTPGHTSETSDLFERLRLTAEVGNDEAKRILLAR